MNETQTSTFERVRDVLVDARVLGVPAEKVLEASHLRDDLGLDSLDRVSFAIALEETFPITISDAAIEQLTTVGSAVRLVDRLTRVAP